MKKLILIAGLSLCSSMVVATSSTDGAEYICTKAIEPSKYPPPQGKNGFYTTYTGYEVDFDKIQTGAANVPKRNASTGNTKYTCTIDITNAKCSYYYGEKQPAYLGCGPFKVDYQDANGKPLDGKSKKSVWGYYVCINERMGKWDITTTKSTCKKRDNYMGPKFI